MHFVANVHDEFQMEVRPEYAEQVGEIARQSIVKAGKFYNFRCPLDGEFKIGANWKETH
jgi:DNA polymerase I-like protein with 3'-5' exonuclease and polymerase domains